MIVKTITSSFIIIRNLQVETNVEKKFTTMTKNGRNFKNVIREIFIFQATENIIRRATLHSKLFWLTDCQQKNIIARHFFLFLIVWLLYKDALLDGSIPFKYHPRRSTRLLFSLNMPHKLEVNGNQ